MIHVIHQLLGESIQLFLWMWCCPLLAEHEKILVSMLDMCTCTYFIFLIQMYSLYSLILFIELKHKTILPLRHVHNPCEIKVQLIVLHVHL